MTPGHKGLKDLTKSQLDLTLGLGTEDTQSLSGVSVSSKTSSKGSDGAPVDVTITKNNKGTYCPLPLSVCVAVASLLYYRQLFR